MSEKRFTLNTDDKGVILIPNSILKDGEEMSEREVVDKLNEQQATIEQLRTQLAICQQSKSDDGGFQVWEVPPIPKGMRISFTTSDGEKDE